MGAISFASKLSWKSSRQANGVCDGLVGAVSLGHWSSMWPRFDFTNVPQRTYEEWGDALRTYPWGPAKVLEPKTFTTCRSSLSTYGFELGASKHECGPRHAYSVSREYEDIRVH